MIDRHSIVECRFEAQEKTTGKHFTEVALKSSPVVGELPAGVRGLRIPCIARSRLKALQVIARGNALGESFPRFLKP